MAGSDFSDVLYEEVFLAAKKLGVSQELSDDMARMVDEGMCRRRGGEKLYIRKAMTEKEIRNNQLVADYLSGMDTIKLKKKYRVSRATVFRIIGKVGD